MVISPCFASGIVASKVYHCIGSGMRSTRGDHPAFGEGQGLGQGAVQNCGELKEGEEFRRISGDVWNVLMDKAEQEAYDQIKMFPKGQRVVACGVLRRWFTDVSGLRLA